jgi:TRAP-type C4-dicarboxylate transport system permease small subunit
LGQARSSWGRGLETYGKGSGQGYQVNFEKSLSPQAREAFFLYRQFRMRKITAFANGFSAAAVICMILLIVIEVVLRKVFNSSTTICDEYTGYFQATVIFLTLAACLLEGRHINVDIITRILPRKIKFLAECFNYLFCFLFALIAVFSSLKIVFDSFVMHTTSYAPSNTPLFIPQSVMLIGLFLFFLQVCVLIFNLFKEKRTD